MLWSEQNVAQKQNIAKGVARNLREFGYPNVTSQMVLDELEKAPSDRDVIGMFSASMLCDHGFEDME